MFSVNTNSKCNLPETRQATRQAEMDGGLLAKRGVKSVPGHVIFGS